MLAQVRHVHLLLRARDYQPRPEFARLCDWWRRSSSIRAGLCALVGIGGAGKTALAERLLRSFDGILPPRPGAPIDPSLPVPGSLFVFSFYDAPSPDAFFGELAAFLLGRPQGNENLPPSYHETISLLERAPSTLLILDGLEKVQEGTLRGGLLGKVTDGRLRDFTSRLADGLLPGILSLITTRLPLPHLEEERPAYYTAIPIERIPEASAVALLRSRGVIGPDSALRSLVHDCGLHALTVDLCAGYLAEFHQGNPSFPISLSHPEDLDKAIEDELDGRRRSLLIQERRFNRIAARYHESLEKHDPAALAIIERLCLFRLPVSAELLTSVFTGPGKEHISGPDLAAMDLAQIEAKLKLLERLRLIESAEQSAVPTDETRNRASSIVYSIHPAVRQGLLLKLDVGAALLGHNAARQALSNVLSSRPDTIRPRDPRTLDLIEDVIHHTFEAGYTGEAWRIYQDRLSGFEHVGSSLGQYERGERICQMFLSVENLEDDPGDPIPSRAYNDDGDPDEPTMHEFSVMSERFLYLAMLGRTGEAFYTLNSLLGSRRRYVSGIGLWINMADLCVQCGFLPDATKAAARAVELSNDPSAYVAIHKVANAYAGYAQYLRGRMKDAKVSFMAASESRQVTSIHTVRGTRRTLLTTEEKLNGLLYAQYALRLNRLDEALQVSSGCRRHLVRKYPDGHHDISYCDLVDAEVELKLGKFEAAAAKLSGVQAWGITRDAKHLLCRSEYLLAECSFAEAKALVDSEASASKFLAAAQAAARGIRIARECGFGLEYIDLLTLVAEINLRLGNAAEAEVCVLTALFGQKARREAQRLYYSDPQDETSTPKERGTFPAQESGLPILLAATHPKCDYRWGIIRGRHVLAGAYLLRIAQALGRASFDFDERGTLPEPLCGYLEMARRELALSARSAKQIGDPRRAEVVQTLARLRAGHLSAFPLGAYRMRKTVLELDLVGYSDEARRLQEGLASAEVVQQLNDQIQGFVRSALERCGYEWGATVMATTGDGAILIFDEADDAHRFAQELHEETAQHNSGITSTAACRWFRTGASTGDLSIRARPGGHGYDIAGSVIANAVRLEAATSPGSLSVDEPTFFALSKEFQAKYHGPVSFKGKRAETYRGYRCTFAIIRDDGSSTERPLARRPVRIDRAAVFQLMNLLFPEDKLISLAFLIEMPPDQQPSIALNVADRRARILQWSVAPGGCGLEMLHEGLITLLDPSE